jgi:iron(III) transport system permease protein
LALVVPLLSILYYSLLLFYEFPSMDAFSSMTISNYLNLYTSQGIRPIVNTAFLVAIVPLAVIFVAVPISWIVVRSRLRGRFMLDNIAFLPLAVPRIVLAVSFLYLALWARNFLPLYGTIFLIALVHVVAFISFATRTLNGALIQIHSDLEDAGRLSGASLSRVLRKVTGPLLKPALFSAWFWVMLLSFRDVTMAVMLSSTDSIVFPAQIWILWNSGIPHQAAAAAVVLTSTAAILMLVAQRLIQRLSTPGGY